MRTFLKFGSHKLVLLGKTQEGLGLYRHYGPEADFLEVQQDLGKVAPYGCFEMADGSWAFGWILVTEQPEIPIDPPQPPVFTKVILTSDENPAVRYEVQVDMASDTAVGCSCPQGRWGKHCKHLYRARVAAAGTVDQVIAKLVVDGVVKDREEFFGFLTRRMKELGYNQAIASAVTKAFGPDHKHASPEPKQEKSEP